MGDVDDRPWEPPLAGDEVEQLLGALNRLRATFRWKAGGLQADGLSSRLPTSALTLGGLLKHLACVEDVTFTVKLHGVAPGEPWEAVDWDENPDWDFTSAVDDTPAELYGLWDGAVRRSTARISEALDGGGLDREAHIGNGSVQASLRRLICDLIEEYGRHTGHADLLREAVDGLVGEDPPSGWSAT